MRVLGLDVGSKTIGVAVSDELGIAAHPREVIVRRGTRPDVERVVALVKENEAVLVVVGLPLALDGTLGTRGKRVTMFAEELQKSLTISVESWDERFSTAGAQRVLLDANLSRERRKQVIDKQAAAYILQGWLDEKRNKKGDAE